MRRIRTARLGYREGKSDKVYEVDLCEVGPGTFVVNFRYGRRGANLREGSKTPIPVTQAEAEATFEALVRSKLTSGYRDESAPAPAGAGQSGPALVPGTTDPAASRAEAILARLRSDPRFKTRWRPSRVAWAAGVLRLSEAEESLLAPLPQPSKPEAKRWWRRKRSSNEGPKDEAFALPYSVAWALGRCGSGRSVPTLRGLVAGHASPDVRRIAMESLRLVLSNEDRAVLVAEALGRLPADLARTAKSGTPEAILDALNRALDERSGQRVDEFLQRLPELAQRSGYFGARGRKTFDEALREAMQSPRVRETLTRLIDLDFGGDRDPIDELYLIDDERTRPAAIAALRDAPLSSNRFRAVRHAFKAAEHRGDAEVFAMLAFRFETTAAGPRRGVWRKMAMIPEVFPFGVKLDDDAPGLVLNAYSAATRTYLRRRAWRSLEALAEVDRPDYVAMASAVLLEFSDDDAKGPRSTETRRYEHGWNRPPTVRRTWFDRFADYHIFNEILYANSPRYRPTRRLSFSCAPEYSPGDPAPDSREEAFPDRWDAAPEALVRLLIVSRCGPVHEFAARALRANRPACDGLGLDVVKRLAASEYDPTARLGIDLAIGRFDPTAPDAELVLILADSRIDAARAQARTWARQHWGMLARVPELVVGLATSRFADTRSFARDLLRATSYPDDDARALVARLVAAILAMGEGDEDRAGDAAETMLSAFRPVLRTIGEGVIRDLLAHPLPQARRLAGELIVGHDVLASDPPADIVSALFASPHVEVRAVGVRILDGMGDEVLIYHPEIVLALIRHQLEDVRDNIRPTVRRLAGVDPAFGRHLGERLVEMLLVPGAPEGVPSHTARVLRDDLREYLGTIPPETVLRLLRSRSRPAQEVGGLLLPTNVDAETLPLDELVRLASCDVLSVREASWAVCRAQPDRIRADLLAAVRLADAKWEDSRRFAFALLGDEIGPVDWPVDALVTLCDSVKPDVQRFGRALIARASNAEVGETLALRLGEHPDPAMQEFAGLFLEQFASGRPETVGRLRFFCTAVLSLVNRGRVAKERVFTFLERVALADEASAKVVAEVLARQSAGAEVSYKGRMLALMVLIHEAYPGIDQPIRVREPEIAMRFDFSYGGDSTVRNDAGGTAMSFAPDLSREPTFFRGRLRKGLAFREAIGALHDVVVSDLRWKPKEREAYKAWRESQEDADLAAIGVKQEAAAARIEEVRGELDRLYRASSQRSKPYQDAQRAYFRYLALRDFKWWLVLDPVVTVHPDCVFFECFSKDESSYGRLSVGYDVFEDVGEFSCGTTNVDYSDALYDEFQKIRSYKHTAFEIDPSGFEVATGGDEAHKEVKIDLPDSWVRGFLQVSSAMSLPALRFRLHPMDVHNLCLVLRRHRELVGPRAMRYCLKPGEPVRVLFEPWGTEVRCPRSIYEGDVEDEIRVWGRRRLHTLERLVPVARWFDVHLLGMGMPSFYVADLGDMSYTLGLSGWTRNDWSGAGNFDLLAPRAEVDDPTKQRIFDALRETWYETPDSLASRLGLDRSTVLGALSAYTQAGRAIWDLEKGCYRLRELTRDPLPMDALRFQNDREARASRFLDEGLVRITEATDDGSATTISGEVRHGEAPKEPRLRLDLDERVVDAECSCNFYEQNKLRQGPCEHILAIRLLHARRLRASSLRTTSRIDPLASA